MLVNLISCGLFSYKLKSGCSIFDISPYTLSCYMISYMFNLLNIILRNNKPHIWEFNTGNQATEYLMRFNATES